MAATTGCGNADFGLYVLGDPSTSSISALDVRDGWELSFDEFSVLLSSVTLEGETLCDEPRVVLVDPLHDVQLGQLSLPEGRHRGLRVRVEPEAGAYSLRVAGTALRGDRQVRFAWTFASTTEYISDLEYESWRDDAGGVYLEVSAVPLFRDDLTGASDALTFDAIAEADSDGDGEVTEAELRAVDIKGVYVVGDTGITDLWGVLEYQAGGILAGRSGMNFTTVQRE